MSSGGLIAVADTFFLIKTIRKFTVILHHNGVKSCGLHAGPHSAVERATLTQRNMDHISENSVQHGPNRQPCDEIKGAGSRRTLNTCGPQQQPTVVPGWGNECADNEDNEQHRRRVYPQKSEDRQITPDRMLYMSTAHQYDRQ